MYSLSNFCQSLLLRILKLSTPIAALPPTTLCINISLSLPLFYILRNKVHTNRKKKFATTDEDQQRQDIASMWTDSLLLDDAPSGNKPVTAYECSAHVLRRYWACFLYTVRAFKDLHGKQDR